MFRKRQEVQSVTEEDIEKYKDVFKVKNKERKKKVKVKVCSCVYVVNLRLIKRQDKYVEYYVYLRNLKKKSSSLNGRAIKRGGGGS